MAFAGPGLERPVELAGLLDLGLKTRPNETALVSLERTWSWCELDQASTRLAGQYFALGLAPGDRVASLMPNRGALLVHYLACFKAGLTATPLNYRYQAPEIDHALEAGKNRSSFTTAPISVHRKLKTRCWNTRRLRVRESLASTI